MSMLSATWTNSSGPCGTGKVEIVLVSGLSGLIAVFISSCGWLRDFVAHKVTLIIPRAGINTTSGVRDQGF